jgi:hypothetical protein
MAFAGHKHPASGLWVRWLSTERDRNCEGLFLLVRADNSTGYGRFERGRPMRRMLQIWTCASCMPSCWRVPRSCHVRPINNVPPRAGLDERVVSRDGLGHRDIYRIRVFFSPESVASGQERVDDGVLIHL